MKFMIFDSNSILNRAFFGMPPLSALDGRPTNAVYGFLNIIKKLIDDISPDAIAAAFDVRAKTFRHKMYDGYKAQRKGMPDDLAVQMPIAKELLTAMNIPILEKEGYEGDDIIGTATNEFAKAGYDCYIVTGDRDSLQLVTDKIKVLLAVTKSSGTEYVIYDEALINEKYGVEPIKMIDIKSIMGDSSDNVPGVTGIGEKGAMALIQKFGSLENVYANIDDTSIKPAQKTKLTDSKDMAFLSKQLVTIDKNVPMEIREADYIVKSYDNDRLFDLFKNLNFKSAINKFGLTEQHPDLSFITIAPQETDDMSIFNNSHKIAFLKDDNSFYIYNGENVYKTGNMENFKKDILQNAEILKTGYAVKAVVKDMLDCGMEAKGMVFDAKVAAYVLNPSVSKYELFDLISTYCNKNTEDTASACSLLFELEEKMNDQLKNADMLSLFNDIEMPLINVLAGMEHYGFKVDKEKLKSFGEMLDVKINQLTETIYFLAGEKFNIGSPKQLSEILFNKLGLPAISKNKTGYSTGAEVLEKLRGYHDIIDNILEYRQLTKLKSTYVEGFIDLIDDESRIHSVFHQTITQTGRISSSEPNLQNIPVRQEMGRELRKMFIARDGYILIDADYSQIELRVLANISNDENMKNAFINGDDIHRITASQVFRVPPELVTNEMRSKAKAVNFGIVYGISEFSLAGDIKVSRARAKEYINNYFETYSGIKEYLDNVVIRAKKDGYVTTIFNRRRYIPELSAQNHNIRSFGERVAMNTPIQGTAADVLKIAMVNVDREFKKRGLGSRIILQVHDELIIESPSDEVDIAKEILKNEMESAGSFSVPLIVDIGTGSSWYDAKD